MENDKTKQFKVNDIVQFTKEDKVYDRSWHNINIFGVIMSISEKEITLKTPNGEIETHKIEETEEFNRAFMVEFSEIGFENEIAKELSRAFERVELEKKNLYTVEEWQKDFKSKVSLLGKLRTFLKNI